MKAVRYCFYILIMCIFAASSLTLTAQQKLKPRLSLTYLKNGQSERFLNIKALVRIDRKFTPVEAATIKFYLNEINEENLIGSINTDEQGLGTILLPKLFYDKTKLISSYNFIAVLENHSEYQDIEKEITIDDATLILNFVEEDMERFVEVVVMREDSSGTDIPQEEVEINILVKRPFGDLPIPEELLITDEDGKVSQIFPDDLPGDSSEFLKVIARIEDSDQFGNIEYSENIDWGIVPEYSDATLQRSLWAANANAPLELVFFVNSLIAIVWGMVFYICYQLFRISKIQ